MQTLTVIIPYSRTTSNFALSCVVLRRWLSNNGFPIKTSKGDLSLENLDLYKLLDYPDLNEWMTDQLFKVDKAESLQLLLKYGVNVDATAPFRITALMNAASSGKVDHLQLLLQHNADIEASDMFGHTALHWAARWCKTECIQMLLQHGAKVSPGVRESFPQYPWVGMVYGSLQISVDRE